MDEAKRTTKELRNQLKTTQQQASKAEAENQASRQTIDILEAQLQQEKKRNKALSEVPGRAYATRGGEEENSNDDTEMGTGTNVNQTSSNNKRNEDMVGDKSRDMYEDEDADVDMDSDMLKSKVGKVEFDGFFFLLSVLHSNYLLRPSPIGTSRKKVHPRQCPALMYVFS